MVNLNLSDVLTCRRVMDYQGICIEYTTGIEEVYINAQDCFNVMVNSKDDNFGYVQSLDDVVFLLKKHHCLSKGLISFDDVIIADYLYSNNINIDLMIKLCDKMKCNKFKTFLVNAKEIILKYGLYVPEPKMKHYDKRTNSEKNLASTLDMNALDEGAYRMNQYTENVYLDLATSVCQVVFGRDLESLRYQFNMLYEDYLSDYITDFEYDMVAYCCKVASYLLKYSDIGIYGIEVFMKNALEVALEDFSGYQSKSSGRTSFGEAEAINDIFDKAMYNVEEQPRKLKKKTHLSQDEIDEFRKYL